MITDAVAEMLERVAVEIREVYEERGHNVDSALAQDPAFDASGRSRSSLSRDLIAEAFMAGASRVGFDLDSGAGGAKQFRVDLGRTFGLVRLRKAEVTADGSYKVVANSSSTWGDVDEDTLFAEEPYVLGYTLVSGQVGDIFLAKVNGVIEGNPGELVLGPAVLLGGRSPITDGSFEPEIDDKLPGFDEGESDETASGAA
ncbi:hypothetical protein RCH21_002623 [Arthrobacter sp. PL16]|uniref:hypothetical protein n=1 Tax=Arthrobacter sp. PL16 TaxID=3071720 RepID=UPI002E05C1EB|nr:hypothetical protein [Arthrobacter sp. PL16]